MEQKKHWSLQGILAGLANGVGLQQPKAGDALISNMLLAKLHISSWDGNVAAPQVERGAVTTYATEPDTVDARILVIPDTYQQPIDLAAGRLRRFWYRSTMPWGNDVWRIMPASAYTKITDGVAEYKKVFEDAVTRLMDNYVDIVNHAPTRLGALAPSVVYPGTDDLVRRYGVRVDYDVISRPDDLRIKYITADVLAQVRESMTQRINEQLAAAERETLEELIGPLRSLRRRLEVPDKAVSATGTVTAVMAAGIRLAELMPYHTQAQQLAEAVSNYVSDTGFCHTRDDLRDGSKRQYMLRETQCLLDKCAVFAPTRVD